ncbi:MAG: lysylphosphatidylglycerol synthase domain-containing protein, partial [Candidatus Woesearchaeota archaeon]
MNKFKKLFFYFIIIIILSIFLYFNKDIFFSLRNISFIDLVLLIFFSLIANLINSFQFNYIAAIFGLRLKFKQWFGLTVTNTMLNYYTPARGGTVLKAFYLKKTHNLAYSKFISLTVGTYFIGFFLAALSAVFFILLSAVLYREF